MTGSSDGGGTPTSRDLAQEGYSTFEEMDSGRSVPSEMEVENSSPSSVMFMSPKLGRRNAPVLMKRPVERREISIQESLSAYSGKEKSSVPMEGKARCRTDRRLGVAKLTTRVS